MNIAYSRYLQNALEHSTLTDEEKQGAHAFLKFLSTYKPTGLNVREPDFYGYGDAFGQYGVTYFDKQTLEDYGIDPDELHGIQSGQSYAAALEWTSRLRAGLDALESLAVRDAVLNAHLSKTEIASALGITRQTLYNRHKELFGELKEQCRRKPRHPIDSTAYRIRDGRTIPAKEKE